VEKNNLKFEVVSRRKIWWKVESGKRTQFEVVSRSLKTVK
jgi:hypothetical protein